jgi:uncharacterized protein YndB with AHSA1/START domain
VIEVVEQINAVQRKVGRRVLEAGEARTVTVGQIYDASVDDVWDACTNPERIPRWFLPISGELRLGGRYQLEGNAAGTIERCDPPRSFAATWEYGGNVSWVEFRVSPEPDGRTRIELDHIAEVGADLWDQFGPGAVGVGWDLGLMGLAIHLASGTARNPQKVAAWSASEEGRRFVTLSSQRWCDASIAAGTSVSDARAAAGRTTAAYTGADVQSHPDPESPAAGLPAGDR